MHDQLLHAMEFLMVLMARRVTLLDVTCALVAIRATRSAARRAARLRLKPAKNGRDKIRAAIYTPKQFRRERW